jgi:tetratricopeptide (TPR) repeat protein
MSDHRSPGSRPGAGKPRKASGPRPSGKPAPPGRKPARGGKPSGSRPDSTQPRGSRPAGSKPGGSKSSGGRPTGPKPGGSKASGGRPTGSKPGRPSGRKPSGPRAGGTDRTPDDRGPRRGTGGAKRSTSGRPTRSRGGDEAPRRDPRPEPRTEAERRAAEVRARRAPRKPVDPSVERQKIEQRQTEQWIDEGSIRAEAEAATLRAASGRPRRETTVDPEVLAEIHVAAPDTRRAERLSERLTSAAAALDRERFDDARRMVAPVVRELPTLAAGHEINGLANYRTGRWREAAESLEQARQLHADPALLPVLADCYRAMKRWTAVDSLWREIRESSPSHDVMAEARIVVAGSYADRGELKDAITLMQPAQKPPKKVREYHLRQWYVLADLLDRAGDTMGATRWFREVLANDADFADTRERLRALGR